MSPAISLISTVVDQEGKGRRDGINIINDEDGKVEETSKYLQKGVKNLCDNGITKLPTKYILPVSDRPQRHADDQNNDTHGTTIDLPIIDFAEFQGPNKLHALNSIAKACEDFGFFQV